MVADSSPSIRTWLAQMSIGPFFNTMAVLVLAAATPISLSTGESTDGQHKVPVADSALRRSAVLPRSTPVSLLPVVTIWRSRQFQLHSNS
jgi:hypothetical protein